MNVHERNARSIAENNTGPMGVLCHHLITRLDGWRSAALFLAALVVEQDRRSTTGGVPIPPTPGRNTTLPGGSPTDREGRL